MRAYMRGEIVVMHSKQLEDRASQDAARIQTLEAQLQQPKSREFTGTRHDAAAESAAAVAARHTSRQ